MNESYEEQVIIDFGHEPYARTLRVGMGSGLNGVLIATLFVP